MHSTPHPPAVRLNTVEAARYCGCSASSLEKMRVRGDGPAFLKLRHKVAYDTADLDRWLEGCRRTSTSDGGARAAPETSGRG